MNQSFAKYGFTKRNFYGSLVSKVAEMYRRTPRSCRTSLPIERCGRHVMALESSQEGTVA